MFRVALVSVYDQGTYGFRLVSSNLKRAGFDVHHIYFGDKIIQDVPTVEEAELASLEGLIRDIRPDLVGLSVTSMLCHPAAAAVAARVKKAWDVPVVLGGPYPSLAPQYCLDNSAVDFVSVGEAEESAVELCQRLEAGRPVHDMAGLLTRRTLSFVRRDPPEDLDAMPFPDLAPSDAKWLIQSDTGAIVPGEPFLRQNFYSTKCSRNCPFNCSFCSSPNVRQLAPAGKALRRRSVATIMEDIRCAREINPNVSLIGFWDDTFPAEARFIEEFAAAYKKEVGLPFHIWAHPKTVKERNVDLLADAGLAGVIMGIESASETTRRTVFHRPETNEEIARVDSFYGRYPAVQRTYDLILDHPWESPTEMEETFGLMVRLKSPFKVNLHSLVLFPETSLAKRAIREGLLRDEQDVIDKMFEDLDDSRYRIQWASKIPKLKDIRRAYWVFLLLCLGNSKIPTSLVRFIADRKILRKHPELLTEVAVIDMRKENDEFGNYVMEVCRSWWGVGHALRLSPRLTRFLSAALNRSTPLALTTYLLDRLVRGLPRVLFRRGAQPQTGPEEARRVA
jgi:anaerobic magnesium-protoporphyrin IX monomethyl ester cyclase